MSSFRIRLDAPPTPLVEKTVALLSRGLAELGGPGIEHSTAPELVLDLRAEIGAEAFAITREGAWRVTGGDERGLLYGVGKFLRGCRVSDGVMYAGPCGRFSPTLSVRGIYFATHFHNFYHDAPLELVARYVEDLALWGCNTLSVWFDMHHYTGIDDPAAQAMIARLHSILEAANDVGMRASIGGLANEAYSTSPVELRADPFPHHYHVEICPAKPEGLALILRWRAEMLRAFADLDLAYFWIWPYDQGGCACAACKPWGGNGFLHNAEAVGRLVREVLPGTKIVLATWEFGYWEGDAEWEAFYAAMARQPDWVDYILAEGHGDFPPYLLQHGPPPHFPLVNFPEISMHYMTPWGGFGANLQPRRLQQVWDSARQYLAGGFPYSEGIFEDLNKCICLQLYWDPARRVEDIVAEYAAWLAPNAAAEIREAIYLLEEHMQHSLSAEPLLRAWLAVHLAGEADSAHVLYQLRNVRDPEQPLALLNTAARTMTPATAAGWRWRLLWLRAALDAELTRSGGCPTATADAYFTELHDIACADHAEWYVQVPSRQSLARLLAPEHTGSWR